MTAAAGGRPACPAPRWVDSHCHLPSLDDPAEALAGALAADVVAVVCVGTDLASSQAAVDLAAREPSVWATVGLHPHDATRLDDEWPALEALARTGHRVVAVGETGFDFFYEHSPRAAQEAAFRRQIALAHELDVALVVHTRDAWDDTFRVLGELGTPRRTVFHCFTGGPAEAARAVALGAYVSFSGIVSFANAHEVRAAAAVVPLGRVLVETDAPYLAPVPHRGEQNRPAWVAAVGVALATARDESPADVASATADNAAAVFGISPPA
ncbi:MAG: TatD family hydrolase [Acidimicrobiia bacterium]